MVLDTSVIIAHFRADAAVTERLESEDLLCVSAVAVGELYYGAYRAPDSKQARQRIRSFLDVTHTLIVDEETADKYGVIRRPWQKKGHRYQIMTYGSRLQPCAMGCRWRPEINTSP